MVSRKVFSLLKYFGSYAVERMRAKVRSAAESLSLSLISNNTIALQYGCSTAYHPYWIFLSFLSLFLSNALMFYSSYLSKTKAQFVPPKPKLLDIARPKGFSFLSVRIFMPSASSMRLSMLADSAMKSLFIMRMV